MNDRCICYNLSNSVVEICVNLTTYRIMPKGYKDQFKPELKDNCIMRMEDSLDPKVQTMLMRNPPLIKLVYFKDNAVTQDTENINAELDTVINYSRSKVMEFQKVLDSQIAFKVSEVTRNINKDLTTLTTEVEALKTRIVEMITMTNALQSTLENYADKAKKKDMKPASSLPNALFGTK